MPILIRCITDGCLGERIVREWPAWSACVAITLASPVLLVIYVEWLGWLKRSASSYRITH